MKALTVYQPWASLIVLGAKPLEFRSHDHAKRGGPVDERIVIHASARPMKIRDLDDLMQRLDDGTSALDRAIALPLIERAIADHERRERVSSLPLSAGIGTAILRKALAAPEIASRLGIDSDRVDHQKFAWPMDDPIRWDEPIWHRGFQGFWTWHAGEPA